MIDCFQSKESLKISKSIYLSVYTPEGQAIVCKHAYQLQKMSHHFITLFSARSSKADNSVSVCDSNLQQS